ncbi:MAG: NAD regulator, partial [Pseudomonadota bacterium]
MGSPTPSVRPATASVAIALNAVIVAIDQGEPVVLCAKSKDGQLGLPYGPFDPQKHRTFEIGLRTWVEQQTKVRLGFVEQLYTFGDKGREAPVALIESGDQNARVVSVGYLALAKAVTEISDAVARDVQWRSWYDFFPWENWRAGPPDVLNAVIKPALSDWVDRAANKQEKQHRATRVETAFGEAEKRWEEEKTLDRYEIIYEAGIVNEARRDRGASQTTATHGDKPQNTSDLAFEAGVSMRSDHRRILATAIGRLRGKLKYRPIIFDLTPSRFTLLTLQRTVEGVVGFNLHKQNFRRHVEGAGLVTKTNISAQLPAGRPAALFELAPLIDRAAGGLS